MSEHTPSAANRASTRARPLVTSETVDQRGPTGRPRRSRSQRLWEDIRRTPSAWVGLIIVGFFVLLAAIGPYIAPYSATEMNVTERFARPSLAHPFGADAFGRDIFSRVIVGARLSFVLAAAATIFSLLLGTPLGLVAGYYRGWIDEALMRLTDALLALPTIILALVIVMALGSSMANVVLAVGIVYAPRIARVVRSGTLSLRDEEFVQAARARGEGGRYILFSEILPNTVAPLIVEASIRMGFAILLATSLSFLGLGASPPSPDWGLMINEARLHLFRAPWLTIFPSIAIALTIVGFNLLGDGIRDILDPRRIWSERKAEGV
jgi:peptide/nickel transport system permease protein